MSQFHTELAGLDHVQLAIPQGAEEHARRFYGKLLGLEEIPKPAALAGRGGCWFSGPGIVLHLGVELEFSPARKAHPAFLVSSLEDLRTLLHAADVSITADSSLAQVRRFYASDPVWQSLGIYPRWRWIFPKTLAQNAESAVSYTLVN
jgi:hypothetical protein